MQIQHGFFKLTFFGSLFAIFFYSRCSNHIPELKHMRQGAFFLFFYLLIHSLWAQDQLSQNRVEKLYQQGMDLVQHSNFGAARESFSSFLAHAPVTDARRSEAEYYVAFCALNLGHKDGEKLIDEFIDHNPSSPKASTAYFDLAVFFYSEANYTKAATYFKKVNFPALTAAQQSEGHFKFGYSHFNQKKLDEALEQFNFVKRQSNAYSAAASYYAGFLEYAKGIYDEALFDLKKAEASPAYSTIVPYLIANVYYRQQRYDTVIEYGNSLKGKQNLTNANEIAMLVAEAYYYKGDFKKSASEYQQYFNNKGKPESGLLFRAGYANYVAGNTQQGVEYLDKAAASRDTVSYYASYYLGILYIKQGNKPLALNAFDYASKNPADKALAEESAFQYGKVSYDAGKPDQAINEFERFLQVYPGSVHTEEVKELLAQAYVNGNNYNKALVYIEGMSSRGPHINRAYQKAAYLKGSEYFNKEEYAQSVVYFNKSLEFPIDPVFTTLASFWNGEAFSIGKKYEDAIANYQRVVGVAAADDELVIKSRYGLGYAYYNLKVYDKALVNFREFTSRVKKDNPNLSDGLIRLADCYYVSKQYSDAIAMYSKAKAAGSADMDYILLQMGVIQGIQQNYTGARTSFNDLIKNYPRSQYRDEAMFQRAQFEIEQGNYQAAVDGLTQLITQGNQSPFLPYAYMRRAASAFNLKQYDRTIADYGYLVKEYPTHPLAKDALLPLQEALNAAGRAGEFDGYLAAVQKANPDGKGFEMVEFESAKSLYNNQDYQKAIVRLSAFLTSYPASPKQNEVKFFMAESHYRLQQFDKAYPVYSELAADMSFDMGSRVVGRMAEIDFKTARYDDAVHGYHRLERLAINKRDQYNAWAGLMESFYLLAQYDSAASYARIILERGSISAGATNKASLYLGKVALAKGDFDTAKDEFINTLNAARDEYGAEAKYLLGEIQHQQKQYKPCYETLTGLITDFPEYHLWVGKAFLLLADNFAVQNDLFQARGTLQSLVDKKFPLESIVNEAKKKLKELDVREAIEKQKAMEADSLDN